MDEQKLKEFLVSRFPMMTNDSFVASFGIRYRVFLFVINTCELALLDLLITLYFLKNYNTFMSFHWIFRVEETKCRRIVWKTIGVLDNKLPTLSLGDRVRENNYYPEIFNTCFLAVDGTERPSERPEDQQAQQDLYSGKKKCHTIKNQLIVDLCYGWILDASTTYTGSTHDATMYKDWLQNNLHLLGSVEVLVGDKGYQGCHKILSPFKTPINNYQLDVNSKINQTRVIVENSIGRLKKFKAVSLEWRHDLSCADIVFRTCCKLTNLDIMDRPLRADHQ